MATTTSSLSSSKILTTARTQQLFQSAFATSSCAKVWEYFLWLTETPRPSGQLSAISEKIKSHIASDYKSSITCEADEIGNILLRRAASPGYEKYPGICIQGHLDMVTTKADGKVFDFDTQPIEVQLSPTESNWLNADSTTLGADNGIGVAAGLALITNDAPMPMLECLFTVDEETTMAGAENLAENWLKSSIFINCDSEEEDAICMGCAGGQENIMTLAVDKKSETLTAGVVTKTLKLAGLNGGHSGCSIAEGLANAAKIMNRICLRLLHELPESVALTVHQYSAGNAVNAIPSSALLKISVNTADSFESLKKVVDKEFATIVKEFIGIEKHMTLDWIEEKQELSGISTSEFQRVVNFVSLIPHGVLRWSPTIPNLVETSTSLGIFNLRSDHFMAHTFTRSSRDSALEEAALNVKALCDAVPGASDSGIQNYFPGWDPNINSASLAACKSAHESLFAASKQPKARVYSVHAGLESGFIVKKYPSMDCISIGPTIENAHTAQEKMLIPSVDRFFALLKKTIENCCKN